MPAHNVKPVTHLSCRKNVTCAIEFRTATLVVRDRGSRIALFGRCNNAGSIAAIRSGTFGKGLSLQLIFHRT